MTIMPLHFRARHVWRWKRRLKDINHLIIGGGHLIQDAQLYFPTCIKSILLASRPNTQVYSYGVGVSGAWSNRGSAIMSDALKARRIAWTTTRDSNSRTNFETRFGSVDEVALDPGLLAAECYGLEPRLDVRLRERPLVALGISDPEDLKAHCERPVDVVYGDTALWIDAICHLVDNYNVLLFTNGATSDRHFLGRLLKKGKDLFAQRSAWLTVSAVPQMPADLVKQIGTADVVISHRLHANIIAFSARIPHIGLNWDRKLLSFFEITRRTEYLLCAKHSGADALVEMVRHALSEGINSEIHEKIVRQAYGAIGRLADVITKNSSGKKGLRS